MRPRLFDPARKRSEDLQRVPKRYVTERLFPLAMSRHAPRFVLKGAALLTLWIGNSNHATRDFDLPGLRDPVNQKPARRLLRG